MDILSEWQETRKRLENERRLKAKFPFLYKRFENPEIRGTYNPEFMKGVLRTQSVFANTIPKDSYIPVIPMNERCGSVAHDLIPVIPLGSYDLCKQNILDSFNKKN